MMYNTIVGFFKKLSSGLLILSFLAFVSSCSSWTSPVKDYMEYYTASSRVLDVSEVSPEGVTADDNYVNVSHSADLTVTYELQNKKDLQFVIGESLKVSFPHSPFISMIPTYETDENGQRIAVFKRVSTDTIQVSQLSSTKIAITYPEDFLEKTANGQDITPVIWMCHPETDVEFGSFEPIKIRSNERPPKITDASVAFDAASKTCKVVFTIPTTTGSALKSVYVKGDDAGNLNLLNFETTGTSPSETITFSNSSVTSCNKTQYQGFDEVQKSTTFNSANLGSRSFCFSDVSKKNKYIVEAVDKWGCHSLSTEIELPEGNFVWTGGSQSIYHCDKTCSALSGQSPIRITTDAVAQQDGKTECTTCYQIPLSGIRVKTMPREVAFDFGETVTATQLKTTLNSAGLALEKVYENGSTDSLSANDNNVSYGDVDTSQSGNVQIEVHYNYNAKTYTASEKIQITIRSQAPKCQTPTITISNNIVTITSTAGGTVYYTTDGTTPTVSGGSAMGTTTQYSDASKPDITSVSTTVIKAIAVKNGMRDSDEASCNVCTVTFEADGGSVSSGTLNAQKIANGGVATKPNVTITKSGFESFAGSTGTWVVSAVTVSGYNVGDDYVFGVINAVNTQSITLKPKWVALGVSAQPSISWDSDTANLVKMTATAATIYYTTDGSEPTASSTQYDDTNKPDATTLSEKTIKAIAVENGKTASGAASFPQTGTISIFSVTFNLDGGTGAGGSSSPLNAQKIHSSGKATAPATSVTASFAKVDAQGKHYDFDGWTETSGGTATFNFDTAITANKTLYAKWKIWDEGDAPTFSVGSDNKITITATNATAIKYTITPSSGTEGPEQTYSSPFTLTDTGTVTIKATAEYANKNPATATKKVHEVSFNLDGGTVSGSSTTIASQRVLDNAKATKPSPDPTRDDDEFAGWVVSTGSTTTAFDFVNTLITQSIALKAKWNMTKVYVSGTSGSPQGNDMTGNGTSIKPFATLSKAFSALNDKTSGNNKIILLSDIAESPSTSAPTLGYAISPGNGEKVSIESDNTSQKRKITLSSGTGILYAGSSSAVTLKNIDIAGNGLNAISVMGGNVTLEGCVATNTSFTTNIISVTSGTITIKDSEIKNNTHLSTSAVDIKTNGSLKVSGQTEISGNKTTGTPQKDVNVKLANSKTIEVIAALTNTTGKIGVTTATSPTSGNVTVINGWNTYMQGQTPGDYITSDNSDYEVSLSGNDVVIRTPPTGYYVSSASSTPAGNDTSGDGSQERPFASMSKAIEEVIKENATHQVPYMIHVTGEITGDDAKVDLSTNVTSALNLTIQGSNKATDKLNRNLTSVQANGQVIKIGRSSSSPTPPNVTVTISNLTITGGASSDRAGGVLVSWGADVTITDCIITGNKASDIGGGLSTYGNTAKAKLVQTSITGNTCKNGAGIGVASGDVTLEDCTITGNTFPRGTTSPTQGKGVSLSGGSLNIKGATKIGSDTDDNDIYLGVSGSAYKVITVTGALANDAYINITPSVASGSSEPTANSAVVQAGTGYTLTESDIAKFHVLPSSSNFEVALETVGNEKKGILKKKTSQAGGGLIIDTTDRYTLSFTGLSSPTTTITRGRSITVEVSVTKQPDGGTATVSSVALTLYNRGDVMPGGTATSSTTANSATLNTQSYWPKENYQLFIVVTLSNGNTYSEQVDVKLE